MPKITKPVRGEPIPEDLNPRKIKKTEKILFCTRCGASKEFYISQADIYRFYGKIPICKKCIGEVYENLYKVHGNYKKAMFYLCREINIPYKVSAYDGAIKEANNKGKEVYQTYLKTINSLGGANSYGTTFSDSDNFEGLSADLTNINIDTNTYEEVDEATKLFWGYGFTSKDYAFLENELANWKQTHKCDNQSELTLLREICITLLNIRDTRERKMPTKELVKELQELMKTAAVDPVKANAASAGKSVDAFGSWIKDIEQHTPAEWFNEQEKYKDMDEFIPYIKKYILRPIKNFITGNRDFQIDNETIIDLDKIDSGGDE